MIERRKNNVRTSSFLSLLFACAVSLFLFSGCIRVQGGAGATTLKDSNGEPTTHSIGFDTNDFLPGATAPGNIDVNE